MTFHPVSWKEAGSHRNVTGSSRIIAVLGTGTVCINSVAFIATFEGYRNGIAEIFNFFLRLVNWQTVAVVQKDRNAYETSMIIYQSTRRNVAGE